MQPQPPRIHDHDPHAVSWSLLPEQFGAIRAMLAPLVYPSWMPGAPAVPTAYPKAPFAEFEEVVAPRSVALLREYRMWTAGIPRHVPLKHVPVHLHPQWLTSTMMSALQSLPLPLTSVLNQGCSMRTNALIPPQAPLVCKASLADVQVDERKVRVTVRMLTGPRERPDALEVNVFLFFPNPRSPKASSDSKPKSSASSAPRRQPTLIPSSATCIARHALSESAGRHYGLVSGDFNPIHSIAAAARARGFANMILQGYAQLALVYEDLVRAYCGGDAARLEFIDVRFLNSLVLPGELSTFVLDEGADPDSGSTRSVMAGHAVGEKPNLVGKFSIARGPARPESRL